MTTWNYIIGNEKDFEGAPDWASILCEGTNCNIWYENDDYSGRWSNCEGGGRGCDGLGGFQIIAQRERVTDMAPAVTNDNINHPLRYTKGDIECIDAIKAATVGKTGIEAVDVGHVIRYLWRYEEKDGLESVKKAEWYIKHLIKELENK